MLEGDTIFRTTRTLDGALTSLPAVGFCFSGSSGLAGAVALTGLGSFSARTPARRL